MASIDWRSNIRFAIRRLRKRPFFTLIAIFSLALGIGANTAMFSLVNAVMLRELPVRDPERLMNVYLSTPDFEHGVFSYPDYRDFRDGTTEVFSDVGATRLTPAQVERDGRVESLIGEAVTGNFFPMLGVQAAVGRTLLPEDDVSPGAHPVVMLGYDYWQQAFAGDPLAVGQEIRLGGRQYTIVGVAPKAYSGSMRALAPAVYAPMMMSNVLQPGASDLLESRANHSLFVQGRLRPGVSQPQLETVAHAVAADLGGRQLESWDPDSAFLFIPKSEVILFPGVDRFIRAGAWLLMVVVALVLLMACTNLAGFLLAQSLDRRKEVAIRMAMGARRLGLAGQMLTETTLLGLMGGAAGVLLAVGLLRTLLTADLPLPVPMDLDLSLDGRVLFFSVVLSLASGLLLGLAPAFQNRLGDLATTLRSETAGAGQGGKLKLRNALVVFQVAVSLVLMLAAGLFLRSMDSIQSVNPGFGQEPTALLSFTVPAAQFDELEGRAVTYRVLDEIRKLPGVSSVGLTGNLHLNPLNTQTMSFNVDGIEPPKGRDFQTADRAVANAEFFEAAGIKIVEGRSFNESDHVDALPVAIISEAMARKLWPAEGSVPGLSGAGLSRGAGPSSAGPSRALGQRLIRTGDDPPLTVVGVAADAKVRSLGEDPRFFVYRPYSQSYTSYITALVRTEFDPEQMVGQLLTITRSVDSDLFVWEAKTMERHLGTVLLPARISALLLSAFAALALLLAVVGLYGIVSYAVSQRRREVGIRVSLGADTSSVVRLLMTSGLRLVVIGSVVGLAAGFGLSRLLQGLLFGVDALDPTTFLVFPAILLAVSALAALIPALAAGRVDPASVLRSE